MLNNSYDFEKPIDELDDVIEELKRRSSDPAGRKDAEASGMDIAEIEEEIARIERRRREVIAQVFANLTPWNRVQMARHPRRPYTLDYIKSLCTDFIELHGDRINADEPAIVGGMGRFEGRAIVAIGHQKGRDLKERQLRNFGNSRPSGFRKALRLMKLAEKFHMPVLSFIDTAGADAMLMSEEEGVSRSIALNLMEMALLKTPILVTVIGEGGSGGALGIALGDRVLMQEHSVYSVISPESCAAILREFGRDKGRASEAAEALKLTAENAHAFGVADEILPEPLGGAHRDPQAAAEIVREALLRSLTEVSALTIPELLEQRYARFRRLGVYCEGAASIE